MGVNPFTKAFWSLSAIGAFYAIVISLLMNETIQRHALYAHKIGGAWWSDPNKPEAFGFAPGQVTPFNFRTADNETLYAWHVLPLGVYAKHEQDVLRELREPDEPDYLRSIAFSLLRNPQSRLVINFHGNAGSVAQGWRPNQYKALGTVDSQNSHVLGFDYRGFGYSTGIPSEAGLIQDGVAALEWALNTAKVPSEQIVLVGNSLGTAVAAAVVEQFISADPAIKFGGLVLISGFSDIPNLMTTYRLGGVLPILSPLRPYPYLQRLASTRIRDSWDTASRLTHITSICQSLRITIIHAVNDRVISWKHADSLLKAATSSPGKWVHTRGKTHLSTTRHFWNNDWVNEFELDGRVVVRQELYQYGGHNQIVAAAPIALAVDKMLANSVR